MTHPHPRTIAAVALVVATSLLFASCSSSSPAATANANTPAGHATAPSSAPSASPADPTSATGTPAGATSPAAASGDAHPCSLVTEQEASAALGADPGPGEENTQNGASSCMYGTSPNIVTVNLVPGYGKALYDHARGLAKAGQLVDVTGVGDAAFGVFTGPVSAIWFSKGDTMVAIGLMVGTGATATPHKNEATTLAKTAASRM